MSEYTFEPFQKVLVRLQEGEVWKCAFYDRKGVGAYHLVIGPAYDPTEGNILPYNDETKHLLGTDNDPAPKWEPQPMELVAVKDDEEASWKARRFCRVENGVFYCFREQGLENVPWRFCEPLRDHFNIPD